MAFRFFALFQFLLCLSCGKFGLFDLLFFLIIETLLHCLYLFLYLNAVGVWLVLLLQLCFRILHFLKEAVSFSGAPSPSFHRSGRRPHACPSWTTAQARATRSASREGRSASERGSWSARTTAQRRGETPLRPAPASLRLAGSTPMAAGCSPPRRRSRRRTSCGCSRVAAPSERGQVVAEAVMRPHPWVG